MSQAVTDQDFEEKVAKGVSIVDFWAAWCAPCHALSPILEDVGKELGGKVTVLKLNVDENPKVAGEHRIVSIPTVKIFKDGEAVAELIGLNPKDQYLEAVKKHIS